MNRKILCIDLRWIDSSGVGVYIKGVMPGIVERLKDVSIIGIGNSPHLKKFSWSHAENVKLIDCRAERYSLAEQIQLPLAISSRTDLFFSPYYTIPLLYRGKLAVTIHDMSHLTAAEIISSRVKHTYAQAMFRTIRRQASVIFTVSDFSRSELLRLTNGPREDNIIVTHLGISSEWSKAKEISPVRSTPYLICVGNVKPHKNLGRLVDAFLQVQNKIPHDLVIVGQNEGLITGESQDFFARVRAAGKRIHLAGHVSYRELLSLVAHARALIMPSLYEGFGLPPVEAMAVGVPVAVSQTASLPEVCGDAALYFDPLSTEDIANKLVKIVCDDDLREQLKEKGMERSKMFTWQSCSSTTAEALRKSLGIATSSYE